MQHHGACLSPDQHGHFQAPRHNFRDTREVQHGTQGAWAHHHVHLSPPQRQINMFMPQHEQSIQQNYHICGHGQGLSPQALGRAYDASQPDSFGPRHSLVAEGAGWQNRGSSLDQMLLNSTNGAIPNAAARQPSGAGPSIKPKIRTNRHVGSLSNSSHRSGVSRESIRHQRRSNKQQVIGLASKRASVGAETRQVQLSTLEVEARQAREQQMRTISPTVRAGSSLRQPLSFLQTTGLGGGGNQQVRPPSVCAQHHASMRSSGLAHYSQIPRPATAQQVATGEHDSNVSIPRRSFRGQDHEQKHWTSQDIGRAPQRAAEHNRKADDRYSYAPPADALVPGRDSQENTAFLSSIEHAPSAEHCLHLDHSVPLYLSHCHSPEGSPHGAGEVQVTTSNKISSKSSTRYRDHIDYKQRGVKTRNNVLNDTDDIDKSYDQLVSEYRAQKSTLPDLRSIESNQRQETFYDRNANCIGSRNVIHAREVSFQHAASHFKRGGRLNQASQELVRDRKNDAPQYVSSSPVRATDATGHRHQVARPRTLESSELLRSQRSSQLSRSADRAFLGCEQSLHQALSSRRVPRHKLARFEQEKFVLNFHEASDGEAPQPVRRGPPAPVEQEENKKSKSVEATKSRRPEHERVNSSPRFSQKQLGRADGTISIIDRGRPSLRKPRLESRSTQQRYVTPTRSHFSEKEAKAAAREDSTHRQMEMQILSDYYDDDRSGAPSNQPGHLANMNFNTQDLIRMTEHSAGEQKSRRSDEWNKLGGRRATQPQKRNANWNSGLAAPFTSTYPVDPRPRVAQADDTFRGESFIQTSFKEGLTTGTNCRVVSNRSRAEAASAEQSQSQAAKSEQLNKRLMQETEFLNEQVHCLNQKYAALKFGEFTEKLWLREELQQIHDNLVQAVRQQYSFSNYSKSERADAYTFVRRQEETEGAQTTRKLTVPELVAKIKELVKQLAGGLPLRVPTLGNEHHFSGGTDRHSPSGTFRTRFDLVDQRSLDVQELEARLQKQKEESDALIANLKKSKADLAEKVKQLELSLEANALTPELGSAKAKTDEASFEAKLKAMKQEHADLTKSLQEQCQIKVNAQSQLVEDIRGELQRALQKNNENQIKIERVSGELSALRHQATLDVDEKERLEAELAAATRQLAALRAQVASSQRSREADEKRLEAHKDQERHWKSGYESIYQKYQKLKENLKHKENSFKLLEDEHRTELKMIKRRAEEAIRFFKEVALQRGGLDALPEMPKVSDNKEQTCGDLSNSLTMNLPAAKGRCFELHEAVPRLSRFSRASCTEAKAAGSNQPRSKSVNSPHGIVQEGFSHTHGAHTLAIASQTMAINAETRNSGSPNPYHRTQKKSYSPFRGQHLNPDATDGTVSHRRLGFSPSTKRKQTVVEKLYTLVASSKQDSTKSDARVLLALEAVEAAFEEITNFKQQCSELCSQFLEASCGHVEDMQVLGFDYGAKIDAFLGREQELREQLEQRSEEISQLKSMVFSYRKLIEQMSGHVQEAKVLKEAQWKNIIEYDGVKNKQKARISKTVREEAARCKQLIADLWERIGQKEAELSQVLQDYESLERDKNCIENELNHARNQHEAALADLEALDEEKRVAESRLGEIEQAIHDVLNKNFKLQEGAAQPRVLSAATTLLPRQHTARSFADMEGSSRDDQQVHISSIDDEDCQDFRHTPRLPRSQSGNAPFQQPPTLRRQNSQQASALDMLHVIRVQIRSLQETIQHDQARISNLSQILEGKHDFEVLQNSDMIFLEDQALMAGQNPDEDDTEPAETAREAAQNRMGRDFSSRNAGRAQAHTLTQLPTHKPHITNYISSGASSRAQTPEQQRQRTRDTESLPYQRPDQRLKETLKRDSLSQSLESFIKGAEHRTGSHNVEAASEENHAVSLSDYARRMQVEVRPPHVNFQTFNEATREDCDGVSHSSGSVHDRRQARPIEGQQATHCPIEAKLLQLLDGSKMKSRTIVSMRLEIDQLKRELARGRSHFDTEHASLEAQLLALQDEKDQIMSMYESENRMRQELEQQVDQVKSVEAEHLDRIRALQKELATSQQKLEQEQIDKLKTEQSAEYWQNSFQEIEKHFLEEKEKAEAEIGRLTNLTENQDRQLDELDRRADAMRTEAERLAAFKRSTEQRRAAARTVALQTIETSQGLEQVYSANRILSVENDQVKRDIQVLLDSYDSFKGESQKLLAEQAHQIHDLQRVLDSKRNLAEEAKQQEKLLHQLHSDLQECHSVKLQKEQEVMQLEQVKYQLQMQVQALQNDADNQRDKLASLEDFTQVIQGLNDQLICQVGNLSQHLVSAPPTLTHAQLENGAGGFQRTCEIPSGFAPSGLTTGGLNTLNYRLNQGGDESELGQSMSNQGRFTGERRKQKSSQYTFQDGENVCDTDRFEEEQNAQIRKNQEMLAYLDQLRQAAEQEEAERLLYSQMQEEQMLIEEYDQNLPLNTQTYFSNEKGTPESYPPVSRNQPCKIKAEGSVSSAEHLVTHSSMASRPPRSSHQLNYKSTSRKQTHGLTEMPPDLIKKSSDKGLGCSSTFQLHGLSSAGSLKIQDYFNTKGTQTMPAARSYSVGCQTDGYLLNSLQREALTSDRSQASEDPEESSPRQELASSSNQMNELDDLGASLDEQIGDCVKLLSNLKQGGSAAASTVNASRKGKEASTISGSSLMMSVSNYNYLVDNDAKKLADIKKRLKSMGKTDADSNSVNYLYFPKQAQPAIEEEKTQQTEQEGMPQTESSLSYDMPLQTGKGANKIKPPPLPNDQLKFISDDGGSDTLSKTTSQRNEGGASLTGTGFSQDDGGEQQVNYQHQFTTDHYNVISHNTADSHHRPHLTSDKNLNVRQHLGGHIIYSPHHVDTRSPSSATGFDSDGHLGSREAEGSSRVLQPVFRADSGQRSRSKQGGQNPTSKPVLVKKHNFHVESVNTIRQDAQYHTGVAFTASARALCPIPIHKQGAPVIQLKPQKSKENSLKRQLKK